MEMRKLGSLEVSLVGLGCNNFGMRCDKRQSSAVVGAALAGVRDEVIIATKFSNPLDDDPAHRGASPRWIAQAVEGSLRRLGVDHIDLYQQHGPDAAVPIEETLQSLDKLVREGKVREIGNSNFSGEQ